MSERCVRTARVPLRNVVSGGGVVSEDSLPWALFVVWAPFESSCDKGVEFF